MRFKPFQLIFLHENQSKIMIYIHMIDNYIIRMLFRLKKGVKIMISAYILITIQPGKTDKTIKEMRKIKNVEKISIIAGEYDIVVRAQVKNLEELLDVTDNIQMVDSVIKTTTQIIEKEITLS